VKARYIPCLNQCRRLFSFLYDICIQYCSTSMSTYITLTIFYMHGFLCVQGSVSSTYGVLEAVFSRQLLQQKVVSKYFSCPLSCHLMSMDFAAPLTVDEAVTVDTPPNLASNPSPSLQLPTTSPTILEASDEMAPSKSTRQKIIVVKTELKSQKFEDKPWNLEDYYCDAGWFATNCRGLNNRPWWVSPVRKRSDWFFLHWVILRSTSGHLLLSGLTIALIH
jgi:hypothetical protein